MSAASDSRTVARAAGVNLVGMAARSSRALVTLFVTRVSGPGVFGLFTLALAVVDVMGRLAIFGMDKSVLKFVPEMRERGEQGRYDVIASSLRIGLALAAVLGLAVALVAPWIASRWLEEPEVALPLRIMALSVLPTTLASLLLAATKALKIMSYDAFVTGMLIPLGLLVLSVPILWAEDDLAVLALAYAATCLAALVTSAWFFRRHFSLARSLARPARSELRRMAAFSTPLGLHDFVQFLSMKVELFILAAFVAPADLGVYALAAEIAFVLRKLRQIFDPILIPLMSEAQDLRDTARLEAQLARVVRWMLVLGVLYVGALTLFGKEVLGVFGAGFVGGAGVLALLCAAQLLHSSTGLLDMAMLVSGRPKINLLNVTLTLSAQTALNLWLIPKWGLMGAAWSALAAYGLISVVRLAQTLWILHLRPLNRTQLKPLAAGALAMLVVIGLQRAMGDAAFPLAWLALLAAFAALYALLLRVLGFEPEDAELLRAVLRRRKESQARG